MTEWNSAQQAGRFVEAYADAILRLCLTYSLTREDAQDICQTIFVKLLTEPRQFESAEHERAYVLRMAANACKDLLKSPWRKRRVSWEETPEIPVFDRPGQAALYREVMALPEKYRTVLNLFYYEELSVREIGTLLGVEASTVTTRLARARKRLRERLGEDWQDE